MVKKNQLENLSKNFEIDSFYERIINLKKNQDLQSLKDEFNLKVQEK